MRAQRVQRNRVRFQEPTFKKPGVAGAGCKPSRACTPLVKEPISIPNTHIAHVTISHDSSCNASAALRALCGMHYAMQYGSQVSGKGLEI